MTLEANVVSAGQSYRVRTPQERQRAFFAAARHSRLVTILRRTLPVFALLILASYFITTRLNVTVGDVTASIDGMQVSNGNLRMLNPTMRGADKKNGNYVVNAEYADQDIQNPKIVKLHGIKADVEGQGGSWSRMKAIRGVFDSQAERLVLQDRITVATSSGITGELEHATLDMDGQILRSHRPVWFELTNGTVKANAMTMRSSEHTLVFRGKVMVHLKKGKNPDKDKAQPGAVPQMPQAMPQAPPQAAAGQMPVAAGGAGRAAPQ